MFVSSNRPPFLMECLFLIIVCCSDKRSIFLLPPLLCGVGSKMIRSFLTISRLNSLPFSRVGFRPSISFSPPARFNSDPFLSRSSTPRCFFNGISRSFLLLSSITSTIKHQTSNIKHQTSNIKHQTSNIKHQTSDIKHQTSNIKQ